MAGQDGEDDIEKARAAADKAAAADAAVVNEQNDDDDSQAAAARELALNTIEHGINDDDDDLDNERNPKETSQQLADEQNLVASIDKDKDEKAKLKGRADEEDLAIAKQKRAIQENPPSSDEGISRLSASAIPIPTELQRHETPPGAVGVRGMSANEYDASSRLRVSVTAPFQSETFSMQREGEEGPKSGSLAFSSGAPLLAATLVEPEEQNIQSNSARSTPLPAVALAEPMREKSDELFVLPESESNRRRLCLIIGAVLCCCVLVGVVVGIVFSNLRDEKSKEELPDRHGHLHGLLRQYYLLQWGALNGGCTLPNDVPLHLSCSNGGKLTVLEDFGNGGVRCVLENNSTQTCHFEQDQRNLQGNRPPARVRDNPFDVPELRIVQRDIVAFCEGTPEDKSHALSASLSFEQEAERENEQDLPADERMGFCAHLIQERPSRTSANNSTETVDRMFGGGGTGFLSTTLLCPDPGSSTMELSGTTCAEFGGLLVGQVSNERSNESVPMCTAFRICNAPVYGCPVADDESFAACHASNCTFPFQRLETARPLPRQVETCSVAANMAEGTLTQQALELVLQPYLLIRYDFERMLLAAQDEILDIVW